MTPDEQFMHDFERQQREQRERTRRVIIAAGRPDVLADFDRQMREIDNGIDGAKRRWNSISSAQRRVLRIMGEGRYLRRSLRSPKQFDACGRGVILYVCRLATARKLCAHELIHVNGGATDPEAEFVLTERGRFVLRWGPIND